MARGCGGRYRMCGFVAIAGDAATEPGTIERGLAAIRHRGPDGDGVWRSQDGRAALGHARLAIIDLSSSGAQPMRSADGRAHIAYNGEIYNYRELAGRVRAPLRSQSDTEVMLELLRERGPGAVDLLRGMFAFAYWDGEELVLVRDRLGIKPLFYSDDGERLIAGSEIAAVMAMRRTSPAPDGRAIDDYLTYLYVPPPRTGVAGIRELAPGHRLRWRPGRHAAAERYWSVPSARTTKPVPGSELRELLADAVGSHLVSDVPVGVFLSGGIDSSSIVALASERTAGRLKTFTIVFGSEGRFLDERGFAREVVDRFGTDHHEIPVEPDVAEILPRLVERFGQPFGNPTAVLTYALSRETRKHVKVALAGDGGDELLGGYPRYRGVLAASALNAVPRRARLALRSGVARLLPKSHARGGTADRLRRFVASTGDSVDAMYFRWVTYLDAAHKEALLSERGALLNADPPAEEYEFLAQLRAGCGSRSTADAAPIVDLESFLPSNVLAYGDRMSMAHALEVRVPFCDHLLAERVAPLSIGSKMLGGVQKGLFRWAMRRDLPRRVSTHRKVGFNPPISAWLRGPLGGLLDDYLGERSVRERALLRPEAVAQLRNAFKDGHGEVGHVLWSLLVLEAWLRWLR
jgi:asparagine synthase (glutamine-hydrolysing)